MLSPAQSGSFHYFTQISVVNCVSCKCEVKTLTVFSSKFPVQKNDVHKIMKEKSYDNALFLGCPRFWALVWHIQSWTMCHSVIYDEQCDLEISERTRQEKKIYNL